MTWSSRESVLSSTQRRTAGNAGSLAATRGHSWAQVVWVLAVAAVLVATVVGVMSSSVAKAATADGQAGLDCVGCHTVELEAHSKLGSGNQACQTCHASSDMTLLRLANGTALPLSESATVCAQCHPSRYDAWASGTHGFPGFVAGRPTTSADGATTCTACHDPHRPRLAFDFTKPHPEAAPPPPAPPRDALLMLGITLAAIAGGIVYTVSGRGRS
jgi:hypothetical protein